MSEAVPPLLNLKQSIGINKDWIEIEASSLSLQCFISATKQYQCLKGPYDICLALKTEIKTFSKEM